MPSEASRPSKPLALGVRLMLLHAISDHRRKHRGLYPRRFELHPEVFCDFELELHARNDGELYAARTDNPDVLRFNGTEVHCHQQASRPKMVSADNVVEYL